MIHLKVLISKVVLPRAVSAVQTYRGWKAFKLSWIRLRSTGCKAPYFHMVLWRFYILYLFSLSLFKQGTLSSTRTPDLELDNFRQDYKFNIQLSPTCIPALIHVQYMAIWCMCSLYKSDTCQVTFSAAFHNSAIGYAIKCARFVCYWIS